MHKTYLKALFFLLLLSQNKTTAQIGIGTTNPSISSVLDITSTNRGLLIPRITLISASDVVTISSPTTSLLVYNNGFVPNGYYYWNGTLWVKLEIAGNSGWSLSGNSGTVSGTNFIGTTDPVDFRIKTDSTDRLNIANSSGQLQTFASGTATIPAYSWVSDTNTGVYGNGADNLGISTNGTERISINSTGQVLINTPVAVAGERLTVSNTTASDYAINGYSTANGVGVYGKNTGSGYGVYGYNSSGTAIYGLSAGMSNSGIIGKSTALLGIGTTGTVTGNIAIGVLGNASGTDSNGVVGFASGTGSDGVYGEATQPARSGVWGLNNNATGNGVLGTTTGSSGIGVSGISTGATGFGGSFTGNQWGTKGIATITGIVNDATNRAAFTGNYFSSGITSENVYVGARIGGVHYKILGTGGGSVSTTMKTSDGERILFAPEAPENWFFDIGEVQLTNGKATVQLDAIFAECISDSKPFKVFVQGGENTLGSIRISRNQKEKSFLVEDMGGSSNGTVQYNIYAIWKGKENIRLPELKEEEKPKTTKIKSSKVNSSDENNFSEPKSLKLLNFRNSQETSK